MERTRTRLMGLCVVVLLVLWYGCSILVAQDQPPTGEPQESAAEEPPAEEPEPEESKPKELTKEEARAKLVAFQKAYNAALKDERARVEAVLELEGALHPDIMAVLGNLLQRDKSERVREAAAKALGSMLDKRAVPFLDKGITASINRKKYEVWLSIFSALSEIADPTCVPPLLKFLRANTSAFEKDMRKPVTAAIDALGTIKHVSAIDGLIKAFELIGSKDSLTDEEQKLVYDAYASAYCRALSALTGQNFTTQLEWQRWWQKNAKTFKFPEEEKKAEQQ